MNNRTLNCVIKIVYLNALDTIFNSDVSEVDKGNEQHS